MSNTLDVANVRARATDRAQDYGVLGSLLLDILIGYPGYATVFGSNFTANLLILERDLVIFKRHHVFLPAALSLLLVDFPFQLEVPLSFSLRLVDSLFYKPSWGSVAPPVVRSRHPRLTAKKINCSNLSSDRISELYSRKLHPGATHKVNLDLCALIRNSLGSPQRKDIETLINWTAFELYEDQMCSIILFYHGLLPTYGERSLSIAVTYGLRPDIAKGVSSAYKALGANSSRHGALLVEGQTLQGRGVAPIDLSDEVYYRVDATKVAESVIHPDMGELSHVIDRILDEELGTDLIKMPGMEDYWSSRWRWCVNGSQTRASSSALAIDHDQFAGTHQRVYRRMASEAVSNNPIVGWDGTTYVSASEKLEHGKSRAIFSCDTRSYFAFNYLLTPVEKRWRGKRVVLDPGKGGTAGIVNRIRRSGLGRGTNVMLDYDDFNSHHSNEVMALVFERLLVRTDCPKPLASSLIASFNKTYVHFKGATLRVLGTLMSGHRATTFINSVLNAAYVRAAVGPHSWAESRSIHVGDDVYMSVSGFEEAAFILGRCKAYGCRMNPTKQSVGRRSAEFLRMGISGSEVHGYLARAVSGFTNGSWVSFDALKPLEGLNNAILSTRTLINRSGFQGFPVLLASALKHTRGISKTVLRSLLAGESALAGAPVFNMRGTIKVYRVATLPELEGDVPQGYPRNATKSYLLNHVSTLEATALAAAHSCPERLLVTSSYSKGLDVRSSSVGGAVRLVRQQVALTSTYDGLSECVGREASKGALAKYPLIAFVADYLTSDQIRDLLRLVGVSVPPNCSPREVAFGAQVRTHNIMGICSYSDAAVSQTTALGDNIFVASPMYV